MTIDRNQLQMMVAEKEDLLTLFFEDAFNYVDADKGLLSFVDSQEHLRILVQRGEYWHLPADRGVSGVAFKTGKTQITEPQITEPLKKKGRLPYRGTGKDPVFSEIAVPLFLNDEVIGILLFDSHREENLFGEKEKEYLEYQRHKVEEALRDRDPWSFRSWWAREQKKKRETILANTKEKLRGPLRDEFARYSDVAIKIAEVNQNGISGPYEILLEPTEESKSKDTFQEERDPLIQSIQQGKAVLSGDQVPRHRCYIPFPTVGPIVGVIKMETGMEDLLNKDTMNKVIKELQKIEIDPLAVVKGNQVNGNYFINFVHNATKKHLSRSSLESIFEDVAEEATNLCGAKVHLYCSKEKHMDLLPNRYRGRHFHVVSQEKLLTYYLDTDRNGRPDRLRRTEQTFTCPVLDENREVIAAISVVRTKESLQDHVNVEVIESLSVLVMQIITSIRMRDVYLNHIEKLDLVPPDSGIATKKSRLRSQAEGEDVLSWLQDLRKLELNEARVVGNFVIADPELRGNFTMCVDNLLSKALMREGKPFPVLICGPSGSEKTYFVEEFTRAVHARLGASGKSMPMVENLAPAKDLNHSLSLHFTQILIAPYPRVALLRNVDTRINDNYAFRFLLPAIDGEPIELANGAKGQLPGAMWFFTAGNSSDKASLKKSINKIEHGQKFYRRIEQSGMVIELPALKNGRDIIYRVVSTATSLRSELKQIQAAVLYYFAVSNLDDMRSLQGAVRTAIQDMGKHDVLKLQDIANRSDYTRFADVHSKAIKQLGQKLIQCG